jgi:hypothetical protein
MFHYADVMADYCERNGIPAAEAKQWAAAAARVLETLQIKVHCGALLYWMGAPVKPPVKMHVYEARLKKVGGDTALRKLLCQ